MHVAGIDGRTERLRRDAIDAAVVSPDGASIAYITGELVGLHVLDRISGRSRLISRTAATGLAWASNGRCIAFAGNTSAFSSLEKDFPTGRLHVAQLTRPGRPEPLGVRAGNIAWSRDGSLAYDNASGIYVIRGNAPPTRLIPARTARLPVWSPDGRTLAYLDGTDVFVAAADGSKRRHVGSRWSADSRSFSGVSPTLNLSWSPDGTRLAYVSRRAGPEDIFVVAPDGSRERRLTTGGRYDEGLGDSFIDSTAPIWTLDGRHIVYLREPPGKSNEHDIWIMRADGAGKRPLTSSRFKYVRPPGGWVAPGRAASAPAPLVEVRPVRTLATKRAITQLSADAELAAYATADKEAASFGVWNASTGRVRPVPRPAFDSVPGDLARIRVHLSGDRVAVLGSYGESEPDGAQTLTAAVWIAAAGERKAARVEVVTIDFDNDADVDPAAGGLIPALAGDGGPVVYSSWGRLRVVESATPRDVGSGNIVAAEGSRILARLDGRLTVLDGGSRRRHFPDAPVAVLDGDRLVTFGGGTILVRQIESGRVVHRRRVALDGDEAATLDASRGLVAFLRAGQVQVMRLSDGRTGRVVPRGAAVNVRAQLEPTGLFVSYGLHRPDSGRIAFYPFESIAKSLARVP